MPTAIGPKDGNDGGKSASPSPRRSLAPGRVAPSGDGARPQPSGLPQDILVQAGRRVSAVAVLGAALFATAMLLIATRPLPDPSWELGRLPVAAAALLASVGFAGVMRFAAIEPDTRRDAGLLYQAAMAFALAWLELPGYFGANPALAGISVLSVWQLLFPVMVPAGTRKVVLASLVTAAALPLTAGIAMTLGRPVHAVAVATACVPVILCGGLGVLLSRVIFDLGRQLAAARTMGSYKLDRMFGRGGMGELWLAEHRLLRRPAVVKLIHPKQISTDEREARQRFEREARVTASLKSPHTVELYDYGVGTDGSFFIVMELLTGYDLKQLVKRFGPQPPGRVVHILLQACLSLAEAHALGLIHRDIKPANLMTCVLGTTFDLVKVLDFGLVKAEDPGASNAGRLTMTGVKIGTPATMAPELILGEAEVDPRTDIYALGCVAYWLLTGERVFNTTNPMEMLAMHVDDQPVPPSQRTGRPMPADLETIVLRCLAKTPELRPQSASQLATMLESCECVHEWSREHATMWWNRHAPELLRPVQPSAGSSDKR